MSSPAAKRPALPALILDRFVPYRLSTVSNRVSRAIARDYGAAFDLTIPEWRIIAVLGRDGCMTARALCDATEMDKVAISRAVSKLLKAGRLKARSDKADARKRELRLTAAGITLYDRIAPLALSYERRLLEAFDPAQRGLLHDLLDKLNAASRALE